MMRLVWVRRLFILGLALVLVGAVSVARAAAQITLSNRIPVVGIRTVIAALIMMRSRLVGSEENSERLQPSID